MSGMVAAARTHRDTLAARSTAARWLILLATLVGLVAMHQLADTGHEPPHHQHAGSAGMAAAASQDPCPHAGTGDCPTDTHGHPGQVCQPGPGGTTPTGVPALAPVPGFAAAAPALSPRTPTVEAAGGSGCGPPSLTQLSLLRV